MIGVQQPNPTPPNRSCWNDSISSLEYYFASWGCHFLSTSLHLQTQTHRTTREQIFTNDTMYVCKHTHHPRANNSNRAKRLPLSSPFTFATEHRRGGK